MKLGRELHTCPYYATRAAIAGAHVVVLPYQSLMHKSTREACGIELKDNVVIIDEAHNLPDAICSMHSNEITGQQVRKSQSKRAEKQNEVFLPFSSSILMVNCRVITKNTKLV